MTNRPEFEIETRVKVDHEIIKGTPGYGIIVKIYEKNNTHLYDVRLEWAISNIGTLTNLKASQLNKVKAISDFL